MDKSKKFRMPAGIRNKLTAAIAMLLVSSIMMVSSTYAWFTLSTAPEVTGITTSVGANGNLEMALLNTETFNKLDSIASAVGNSSANANTTVQQANVTWGNLVDLSDVGYGLHLINLQPSRLNFLSTTQGQDVTYDEFTLADVASLLLKPVYGKDGRVSELSSETYATTYVANTGWAYDASSLQYGVRAIGANDNLSPQQAGLIAAKSAYSRNLTSAKSTVQTALSANGNALASALTTLAMGTGSDLTSDQTAAIDAMITASETALNYIDAAYKQVLLGLATMVEEATAYEAAVDAINGPDGANNYAAALAALPAGVTVPSELAAAVNKLNEQKANVETARTEYAKRTNEGYKAALALLVDSSKVTINGFESSEIKGEGGAINSDFTNSVIKNQGANVEMPDGSGVFAYVGSVAGNYEAGCSVSIKISESQSFDNLPATMKTVATVDSSVGNTLNDVEPAAGTGGTTVLSDTFGYALDFAFRTNAAESYLQLQTAAAQRVYSDSDSAATLGAGSSMTFQVTKTDAGAPTLTPEKVKALMGAIRVAFINPNPESKEVYGIAALTDIIETADGFKGDLYLHTYDINNANGVMTLTGKRTTGFEEGATESAIMKLGQSVPARLTVVVWLDGDMVDNADVANAAQSLIGTMNLQFSSSAELIPMQNTALHDMTITYTELADDNNYKVRLYNFNGVDYALKTGYKLYTGSDNSLYFSNDESTYTKLTIVNYSTAMAPLTATVNIGDASIDKNATTNLEVSASAGTITGVEWVVDPATGVATITPDGTDVKKATVLGVEKGVAKVTAKITIEFTGDGATPVTKQAEVKFDISVASYNVSFDANGGTGEMATVSGIIGNYVLPACTFTRADTETHTYTFAGWDVDGTVYQPTATITVSKDTVVKATWTKTAKTPAAGDEDENQQTPDTYAVSIGTFENGTVTIEGAETEFAKDASVKLIITAAENHALASLSVDGASVEVSTITDGTYTFTMPDHAVEVVATFAPAGT